MLTKSEKDIINKYINEKFYDRNILETYLDKHDIIANEIFSLCDRCSSARNDQSHSMLLDNACGYTPVSRDVFIKRIPFYFYVSEDYRSFGSIDWTLRSLDPVESQAIDPQKAEADLEKLYQELEYLFYEKNFALPDIFTYIVKQYGIVTGPFLSWADYIHMCDSLGWNDYFPDSFISRYNYALEACGRQPVIYYINPTLIYTTDPYYRKGKVLEFEGTFPVDEEGRPVLRWTNIIAENAVDVSCTTEKSMNGCLHITVAPDTVVYAKDIYKDSQDNLYVIYAGPQHMWFSNEALKSKREAIGYTQKEVAEAIGTSVRTYQKWEEGVTTPDSRYMLRLINWLDISDPTDLISLDF